MPPPLQALLLNVLIYAIVVVQMVVLQQHYFL